MKGHFTLVFYTKGQQLFLNGHSKYFQILDQYVNMDSVTTLNCAMKAQEPLNKILTTCMHADFTLKRLKQEESKFEVILV